MHGTRARPQPRAVLVVKALDRKLWRDLAQMRGQVGDDRARGRLRHRDASYSARSTVDSLDARARPRTTSGIGSPTCSRRSSARRTRWPSARRDPRRRAGADRASWPSVTLDIPGVEAEPAHVQIVSRAARAPPLNRAPSRSRAAARAHGRPDEVVVCDGVRRASHRLGARRTTRRGHQRQARALSDRRRSRSRRSSSSTAPRGECLRRRAASRSSGWTTMARGGRATWRARSTTSRSSSSPEPPSRRR